MFTLGWLVVVAATYFESRSEIEKLFDSQLERSARVRVMLWAVVNSLDDVSEIRSYESYLATRSGRREKLLVFQVKKNNQLLYRTPDVPAFRVPQDPGYSWQYLDNQEWRVFTVVNRETSLTVQAGEPFAIRSQLVYEITRNTLVPLLMAIPLLAAMIWLGVGRGLHPIKKVTDQVAQRSAARLQPLETKEIPVEIKFFVDELNTLLGHLREAFNMERQFTANAAHEIRTPLASLKTHAQVALRTADNGQREERLQRIIVGVDRMTHLVGQLLTLARLDYEAQEQNFARVDLVVLVREILAEIAPMALDKGIDLGFAGDGNGAVNGNATALGVLVRNLVDNAIRYTPSGGVVEVEVTGSEGTVTLTVADSGPGIPLEERVRVFDRFYRGNVNDSLGCGLGLSIVKRIAELHDTEILLDQTAPGPGLKVSVSFPASPDPSSPKNLSGSGVNAV